MKFIPKNHPKWTLDTRWPKDILDLAYVIANNVIKHCSIELTDIITTVFEVDDGVLNGAEVALQEKDYDLTRTEANQPG